MTAAPRVSKTQLLALVVTNLQMMSNLKKEKDMRRELLHTNLVGALAARLNIRVVKEKNGNGMNLTRMARKAVKLIEKTAKKKKEKAERKAKENANVAVDSPPSPSP